MPDPETTEAVHYPGQTDEAHPELFDLNARPPTPAPKPGQLSEEQVKQFFEVGYVLVENFFPKEKLETIKEDITKLVDGLAQKLYNAGKIKNLYQDAGLFERLSFIEKEFPGANIIMMKQGIMPESIQKLWSDERLLNVIEQFIGPDIAGHPVWNLRSKTPKNEATTVPWHQDVGYLSSESYQVLQPTAWIPLLDTDETNGCLQMVKEGHRTGKIATHQCCYGDTWYVMLGEEEMERTLGVDMKKDVVTIPVPYGGVLFFNNLIPHRSLNNVSTNIRWSLDLRWQTPDKPVGFHGLKEGILMRTSKNPNHNIDWETFLGKNRTQVQSAASGSEESDFDTTIHGPWMKRWEMVHENRHTATLFKDEGTPWHGHDSTINP